MFKFVAFCALLTVALAKQKAEDVDGQYTIEYALDGGSGERLEVEQVNLEDLKGPHQPHSAHLIHKRSFGVLENAGLGAAAAALNTFAGSFISANEASAVAANPNNRGQNYPSQASNLH